MRKIFIDLGVMDGRSIEFFKKHHPDSHQFEVFGFECLEENLKRLSQYPDVSILPYAAWTENGKIRFYTGKLDGSSVCKDKKTGGVRPDRYTEVDCIDFAEFITSNFSKDDYIVLKMNVEGAEYGLIEHLQKHNLIEWVDKWYMCWHWHKIGMPKEEHDRIEAMIPKWYPWHPGGPDSIELFDRSLED